ncbi:hypothetical protein FQN50_005046 [Emmonsiellopsis sp. PD_5]|nr:hypothetical protein FQN50_005046 [Emmonsiellopsis sp. PD_5]
METPQPASTPQQLGGTSNISDSPSIPREVGDSGKSTDSPAPKSRRRTTYRPWTQEEDARLINLRTKYSDLKWDTFYQQNYEGRSDRTSSALMQRLSKTLKKNGVYIPHFTSARPNIPYQTFVYSSPSSESTSGHTSPVPVLNPSKRKAESEGDPSVHPATKLAKMPTNVAPGSSGSMVECTSSQAAVKQSPRVHTVSDKKPSAPSSDAPSMLLQHITEADVVYVLRQAKKCESESGRVESLLRETAELRRQLQEGENSKAQAKEQLGQLQMLLLESKNSKAKANEQLEELRRQLQESNTSKAQTNEQLRQLQLLLLESKNSNEQLEELRRQLQESEKSKSEMKEQLNHVRSHLTELETSFNKINESCSKVINPEFWRSQGLEGIFAATKELLHKINPARPQAQKEDDPPNTDKECQKQPSL